VPHSSRGTAIVRCRGRFKRTRDEKAKRLKDGVPSAAVDACIRSRHFDGTMHTPC
jgi:hypothetical protein